MSRKKAIGIDLGTSKCCVGIFRDCKVEILENERGNKTTPSYVAFTDTERLVGEEAKDQATLNPANTVFGVKRIIGRESMDGLLREAVDKMPYTIMNRNEEETCIRVSYKGTEELLLPQQITAMLLSKMKDLAEHHLKSKVEEAVISVPASFTNAQRQATKDAATIAGLKVLALINEPTAAAIAYQANRRKTDEENVAVVDFGAGNFDIAIVTVRRGRVSVRAVSGSSAIGGNEIDEVLMEHVVSKFEDKHRVKLPESSATTERLRSCCEKLKRKLTLLPKVQETLDCFGDDIVLTVNMKRGDFNSMIPSEMQSSLKNRLHRTMQASGLSTKDLSRVVLVGGTSRIPLFQTWLEEIMGPNLLDRSVNPDEAVAFGATLYAALLCGDNELDEFAVEDCVPNDYCYSSNGDSTLHPVFEQRSSKTLPQRRVFLFNGQSPLNKKTRTHTFEIHEELAGQRNPHRLIGTLCLEDEFRQAVSLVTNVTFEIDRCGIFNAIVRLDPNHDFPEVVKKYAGKLSGDKLNDAVGREQQFRRDDRDERERVEAMSRLEALIFHLHSAMGDIKAKELFPEIVKQISDEANQNIQWLDVTKTVPKAECVKRQNKLEKLKNDLESKIKLYEQDEQDRLAAVTSLESYCSSLKTSVGTAGMADETELVAALGEQLEEATEWLKTSEKPSKEDCDDRKNSMKKVQVEMERRLEIKRREDERRTAVDDLLKYCSKIRDMIEGNECHFVCYDVRRLSEENDRCMKYLSVIELPSKAECDSRKQKLEKMVCEAEKLVEKRRASQLESERNAAVTCLRRRCTDLEKLANGIPYSDTECHPMAALGIDTLKETRRWLGGPKTVTTEECANQQEIIENYLNSLEDLIKRDHVTCLGDCKARFAYVERTLLIELAWKKERRLCDQVISTKDELFRYLESDNFSRKDYDKKRAKFETAVGTLKNKLKIGNQNTWKNS